MFPWRRFRASFAGDLKKHLDKTGHWGLDTGGVFHCPKCRDMFPLSEIESHYEECREAVSWRVGGIGSPLRMCTSKTTSKNTSKHF